MSEWIGHEAAERGFLSALAARQMPHAWLLSGPRGLGKAAFAKRAARVLLTHDGSRKSLAEADRFDKAIDREHPANALIDAKTHPDLTVLERAVNEKTGALSRGIPIDQVRALTRKLGSTASMGGYRVAIIDGAELIEPQASNALLKTLEEPPSDTVFFLVSHASGRLLPTIRSRCRTLNFRPLSDDVMTAWLKERGLAEGEDAVAALAMIAGGSPGTAIDYADRNLGGMNAELSAIIAHGDPDGKRRAKLSQALALKAASDDYEAFLVLAPAIVAGYARANPEEAAQAIATWSRIRAFVPRARAESFDPAMTVYEIASWIAALARQPATSEPLCNAGRAG